MSQSLSKLYIHIVFHIKRDSVPINQQDSEKLYAYIGAIIKDNDSHPIIIGGVNDHVHILCIMSKNVSLSKFIEEIKRHSSRWMKTIDERYEKFAWQGGYGGFSVSPALYNKTKQYIENQESHHKKMTFKEEYQLFLKEYGIDYDERYVWTD